MKFNEVFKTNAINMIIGEGDYSIAKLKRYLTKSFSIIDFDGFGLSSLSITKGKENEKLSLMIIDMRNEYSDFNSIAINLINDYVKNNYDITLLVLCTCARAHSRPLTGDLRINCETNIVYLSQCIFKFIDSNSYEVIKSLDCELHEIINLVEITGNHFYKDLLGIEIKDFNPNPKHGTNENGVNDCFIRAMCKLLNKTWDEVYADIVAIGFEEKEMYNSVRLNRKYLKKFGFILRKFKYREATIGQFMYEHKTGRYLIGDRFHILAYIDGIIYDKQKCLKNIDTYLTGYASYIFTDQELNDDYLHEYESDDETECINANNDDFALRGSLYQDIKDPNVYYLITIVMGDYRIAAELNPITEDVVTNNKVVRLDNDIVLQHRMAAFVPISVEYIKSSCLGIMRISKSLFDELNFFTDGDDDNYE